MVLTSSIDSPGCPSSARTTGASLMHSGRVPAKISTSLDAAIDPVPIGVNGNMRDRSALDGDECISFRIADTRKRTAEVICLAEKDLNFGFGLLALKAKLSPDKRLQMLAPNVTNLFRPRYTFSTHENVRHRMSATGTMPLSLGLA